MKIDFVRAGGLAGLRLRLKLDTDTLAAADASRIATLVEKARFFERDQSSIPPPRGRDLFEYHLSIEAERHRKHVLILADTAVPDGMAPLLEHLAALATRAAAGDERAKSQNSSA